MNEVCALSLLSEYITCTQSGLVYVGKAASLAFLQLLRDTVTQHIGPSQFSHNARSEDMLETETHHDQLNFSNERCNVEQKRHFIQNYEAAVRKVPTK